MKPSHAAILLIALGFFSGCRKKNEAPEPPHPREIKKIAFAPPADASLTLDQIQKMKDCDGLLDSLSVFYRDSFKIKDAVLLSRFQEDFSRAQDKICLRAGLAGGYMEYIWILKNLGNPKNAKLLDSIKMKVY